MNIFRMAAVIAAVSLNWLAAPQAFAWGDEGHEVIGLIAEHYLTPAARQQIDLVLAQDHSGLAATDTGDALADETTWADKYRDADHRGLHYIATRDWHFVDLELDGPDMNSACFGRPVLPPHTLASAGPAHDCVVDKIEQFEAELSNPRTPGPERLLALQFLLHLVGDLHQPLHASDDHDRGGNEKRVQSADLGSGTLHGFWDTRFVEASSRDPRAVAASLVAKITPADKAAWDRGTPEQWAMGSYAVSKQIAYGALPLPGPERDYALTASYEARAKIAVAQQLSKAGVRLAGLLNRGLGQAGPQTGGGMKVSQLAVCGGLALATVACSRSPSPGTIAPDQSGSHVGQTVTVEGTVSEVHTARSGSATFIDVGGDYPNNSFTGVIFAGQMAAVGDLTDLAGKTVDINGTVRLYRGKPEIVIESRDQIKLR
jgi:hypothetical protein